MKAFGVFAPALAAAAAVAYLAIPSRHAATVREDASSASSVAASEPGATASGAPAPAAEPADETAEAEDPLFAVLTGEPGDVEPLDLGPLMGGPEDHAHGSRMERSERQMERSGR